MLRWWRLVVSASCIAAAVVALAALLPSSAHHRASPTVDFGAGRCNPLSSTTSSTHAMPNPLSPGPASRIQFVADPDGSSNSVLRVQLAFGDAFYDGDPVNGSTTTRVELANDRHSGADFCPPAG